MKHGAAQDPFGEFQIFLLILGEHHLKFHSCKFPEWEILRFRVMTSSLMGGTSPHRRNFKKIDEYTNSRWIASRMGPNRISYVKC